MKTIKILLDFGQFVAGLIIVVAILFADLSFGMKLALGVAAFFAFASVVYDAVKNQKE